MNLFFSAPADYAASDAVADLGYDSGGLVYLSRVWRRSGAYETFAFGTILRRHVNVFELVDRLWVGAEFRLRREFVGPLDIRPLLVSGWFKSIDR